MIRARDHHVIAVSYQTIRSHGELNWKMGNICHSLRWSCAGFCELTFSFVSGDRASVQFITAHEAVFHQCCTLLILCIWTKNVRIGGIINRYATTIWLVVNITKCDEPNYLCFTVNVYIVIHTILIYYSPFTHIANLKHTFDPASLNVIRFLILTPSTLDS